MSFIAEIATILECLILRCKASLSFSPLFSSNCVFKDLPIRGINISDQLFNHPVFFNSKKYPDYGSNKEKNTYSHVYIMSKKFN